MGHRFLLTTVVALGFSSVIAQVLDYDSMIALRTSAGFRAALEAAKEELARDPNDGIAYAVSALVYANGADYLGMGAEAAQLKKHALSAALRLAPTSPYTRAAYGLIHLTDDTAKAERYLQRCIDENPEFLECYNVYGDLLRKTGRVEEAQSVYEAALERWPRDGELRISLALLFQESGNPRQGLQILERLVNEQAGFARGHWHLAAMLYETEGNLKRARRAAERAIELDPVIWNADTLLRLISEAEDYTSE